MSDIASAFAAGTEAARAAVDGRVGSMAGPSGASDRGMRGGRAESATDHPPDGRPGLEQRGDAVGDRRAHHQEDEDDGDELLAVHAGSRILGQLGVSRRVGFVGQGRRTSFASARWGCSLAVLGAQSTARPRRRESPGGVGRRSRARAPPRAPLAGISSGILLGSAVVFLDVSVADVVSLFVGVELLGTLSDREVGILLSLFAETEFRAIRFIPVLSSPQAILGGTFRPVARAARLSGVARARDANHPPRRRMERVVLGVGDAGDVGVDLGPSAPSRREPWPSRPWPSAAPAEQGGGRSPPPHNVASTTTWSTPSL